MDDKTRKISIGLLFVVIIVWLFSIESRIGQSKPQVLFGGSNLYNNEIQRINDRIKPLEDGFADISWRLMLLDGELKSRNSIDLNLTEKGYGKLETNTGFFFISCAGVENYLDGYKIILNIGNPLAVSYMGFKLKVKWGKPYDIKSKPFRSYDDWEKTLHKSEKSFTDLLKPASWNKVELILSPATAEDVKYVNIEMGTDNISLYEAR
jgi:hypothetical protein